MDNRSVWEMSKYDATNYSGYFEPGYSIIDLDLDGQPELVVTMAGGTMHNAPTNIYKVQDGKVVLISSADAEQDESQDLTLYYNNAEGLICICRQCRFIDQEYTLLGKQLWKWTVLEIAFREQRNLNMPKNGQAVVVNIHIPISLEIIRSVNHSIRVHIMRILAI